MKNLDLFKIKASIERIKKDSLGDPTFRFKILLNERKVDERIEALNSVRKPSEEIKEYNNELDALIVKYAEKNADGNVLLFEKPHGKGGPAKGERGYPHFDKNKSEYEKEVEGLSEKYSEAIRSHEQKIKEFEGLLNNEVEDLDFIKIPIGIVPVIEYEYMEPILPLIQE